MLEFGGSEIIDKLGNCSVDCMEKLGLLKIKFHSMRESLIVYIKEISGNGYQSKSLV